MPDQLDSNILTYFELLQTEPFLYLMKETQHPVSDESQVMSITLLNHLAVFTLRKT